MSFFGLIYRVGATSSISMRREISHLGRIQPVFIILIEENNARSLGLALYDVL